MHCTLLHCQINQWTLNTEPPNEQPLFLNVLCISFEMTNARRADVFYIALRMGTRHYMSLRGTASVSLSNFW